MGWCLGVYVIVNRLTFVIADVAVFLFQFSDYRFVIPGGEEFLPYNG